MDIEQIIALANYLDENGAHEEANKLDAILREAGPYTDDDYMDFMFGSRDAPPYEAQRSPQDPTQPDFKEVLKGVVQDYLSRNPQAKIDVMSACGGMARELGSQLDKEEGTDMALDDFGKYTPFGSTKEDSMGLVEQVAKQLDLPDNLVNAIKHHVEESAEKQPDGAEPSPDMTEAFSRLSSIADRLDSMGHHKEANILDEFIAKHAEEAGSDDVMDWKEEADTEQSKRYDAKHHHDLLVRKNKGEDERVDREGYKDQNNVHTMQPMKEAMEKEAASSRYCPEHVGVMMGRIGEATYQCPLDGKTYNWETGFTDYDGKHHQGGSVAAQTPQASEYSGSHRIFDSRENILNRIN